MNRMYTYLAVAGAACLLASRLPAQAARALPVSQANDTAQFLAGMAEIDDATVLGLTQEPSWQRHAKFFDAAWASLERNQLGKVRAWAKTNTPDAFASKTTLFYMFSGPDFLYADTLFPNASTYILCGIEPIGPLPDVSKLAPGALVGELRALRESIDSVLSFSFFLTKEMKVDFQGHTLSGTLPILYIFLARSGKTICEVSYVSLDSDGVVKPLTAQESATRSAKSPAPGVRISFVANGSDTPQTLYYFSTDISDSGLKQSGFLNFCKTHAPANSCVKSASYLMHESYFSKVRSFLLENSSSLVQDDSGVPCSYFTPEAWRLQFFGSYPGPIPLFKNYSQPKLAEYYRTSNPAPLDFGIGYRHRAGESTLMVATRKPQVADAPPSNEPPPAPPPAPPSTPPAKALPVLDWEAE
jgi:hypothetical protein